MFKLTVVSGPSRGAQYSMKEGENVIGRVEGNDIVLASAKVSKRHCALVVNNKEVMVKDLGSSNGTFVNGVLTKLKKIGPGDRVSVGEFVFELTQTEVARPRPMPAAAVGAPSIPVQNFPNNVIPMHNPAMGMPVGMGAAQPSTRTNLNLGMAAGTPSAPAPPKDLKEKLKHYFETYVINFLYNLNEKQEWRSLVIGLFIAMTVSISVLAVYPVLERVDGKLNQESIYRASFIARQIAERNAQLIFDKLETKVDVGFAEREPGVLGAYLVDIEGRIMAPARDLNQYLTESHKANFSAVARKYFSEGDKTTKFFRTYDNMLAVAEPVRIFSSQAGRNVTVALALVFFDRDMILFDPGTIALTYIQSIILAAIVSVLIFFTMYKLTLRPLTHLNEEIDQALKNQSGSINKKFKMEEIDSLIDIVNASLQRAASGGGGASGLGGGDSGLNEDTVSALKFLSERSSGTGVLLFAADKRVQYLNPAMEDITGMRSDASKDQDISASARDAAFISFVNDALSRAAGGESVAEDFEFSGTAYKIECSGVGALGNPKAFIMTAQKVAS